MKRSLTRRERLSNKKEIKALFQQGKKVDGEEIKLIYRPNKLPCNRVLITVQRGFRTAVRRNRQKRLLKEIFRNQKSRMSQGFDIGFVVKKEASSFRIMQSDFFALLDRARLFKLNRGEPE